MGSSVYYLKRHSKLVKEESELNPDSTIVYPVEYSRRSGKEGGLLDILNAILKGELAVL